MSPDEGLPLKIHRFEFIELIVRLGIAKYKDTMKVSTLTQATEEILKNNILPNNPEANGHSFRMVYMYNFKVDEIMRRN